MPQSLTAAFLAFLSFFGLADPANLTVQGYVEAEYVLVAPQFSGTLTTLSVSRGDAVKKGDSLFLLDKQAEALATERAEAEAAQKAAQLTDLIKGKRQPELDALIASRDQAAAAFQLAKTNLVRDEQLLETKAVSQADLDSRRSALDQTRAKLEEAEALLLAGQLSVGRDDAIRAAQAALLAANAARAEAQWREDQKSLMAPVDAFVFDTLYKTGEFIQAGQPVVSLLPPENIKVRFFVTEPELATIRLHEPVQIEALDKPIKAHISYISPKAEYTPPQLFNRENRSKLLYMIEAVPDAPSAALHPGQPVDVRLSEKMEP